jgi:hypothetical protein
MVMCVNDLTPSAGGNVTINNYMGLTSAIALFIMLSSSIVSATTIIAVRTPTEIYVGADSKATVINQDGTVFYRELCKIQQFGSIFFAAAGPTAGPGLDIRASFKESQAAGGTLHQIASRFADIYATAMAKTSQSMRYVSAAQYAKLTNQVITITFFGFDGEIPVLLQKRFAFAANQPENATNIDVTESDCPPVCEGMVKMLFIGHADAIAGISQSSIQTQTLVEMIRERIALSIKSDPENSGHPIDILHLTRAGAKWIQNEKQCPAIQPY